MTAFKILVVEDDELVRIFAVEMLEDAGLEILQARNADEAWAILMVRDDVGTLFTDVDMPGSMCGVTLAERVSRQWPFIRIVITSGRNRLADRDVPDRGLFVAKPYRPAQVLDAIESAV